MNLSPVQIARLEIQINRSKLTIRHLMNAGANQYGHGLHDSLMEQLKRSADEIRTIGRSIGHTRNALHVSKYKREAWNERARRQSHMHGVNRLEGRLKDLLALVEELFKTTKERDDPNGGLFDLSKEIADGIQKYQQVISVDVRNDADVLAFQSADPVAADPLHGVIMLIGLGLEMWRLHWERRKRDKAFAEANPNWK